MPRKKIKRKHKHKKAKFKHEPFTLDHKFNYPETVLGIYESAKLHGVLEEVVLKHLKNSRIKDNIGGGLILPGDIANNYINVKGVVK